MVRQGFRLLSRGFIFRHGRCSRCTRASTCFRYPSIGKCCSGLSMQVHPVYSAEAGVLLEANSETQLSPTADPDTEIVAVSSYLPGDDEVTILANLTSFKSSKAEAEAALAPIHASRPSGAKIEVFCEPTSLAKEYGTQAASNPEGHRYCAENAYVSNGEDVPAVLEESFTTPPSKKSFAIYFAMNPTSRRALPAIDTRAGMALSMQSDHYFALYSCWENEDEDEKCTSWVRRIMAQVEQHSDGAYLGDSDFQHRRTKFWTEECGKRLMEIRKKWDPKGRICGYLDEGDRSGVEGLKNEFEWMKLGGKTE